ncbi:MAG: DUF5723 family protein [Saprospiraceae bacterium]
MSRQIAVIWTLFMFSGLSSAAQGASFLFMKGSIPGTFINPGLVLDKTVNISVAGLSASFTTNGPSINDVTSKNSSGDRYIDVKKIPDNVYPKNDITAALDIHTLDIGIKTGLVTWLTGHAYRSSANINYPGSLVELAAKGNAAFVGQKVSIGTSVDVSAYNEIYLGAQVKASAFSIGLRGKILYGAANILTEKSSVIFQTKADYYQLELENDYLLRSSGLLRYHSLDSITLDYKPVTFENLFFNNRGFAFDVGATYTIGDKLMISASALDIGYINWDFFPRKYSSKGVFSFEGIDILDFLGDSTSISVSDSLLNSVKVTSSLENYKTSLSNRFTFGCAYDMNDHWSFNALFLTNKNFGYRYNQFSVSLLRKFSFFHTGLICTFAKNNLFAFGLYGKINAGPFSAYLNAENVLAVFRPLDSKSGGLRIGTTLQF